MFEDSDEVSKSTNSQEGNCLGGKIVLSQEFLYLHNSVTELSIRLTQKSAMVHRFRSSAVASMDPS